MENKQDKETTTVVFRRWPDGSILALFPEEKESRGHCMSYERIGQHGGADYSGCVARTKPATPSEYAPLQRELERIGYNLKIRSRAEGGKS